jgi:hypothetical protein
MIALPNRDFLRSASAAHTTPPKSPEKNFPLWEAKFVNPLG